MATLGIAPYVRFGWKAVIMDAMKQLMFEDRDWCGMAGASADALDELRGVAPTGLPTSYVSLLAASDGGEGPLPINPFNLCLDPVREVIARIRGLVEPAFKDFLIFGGNGGGEYLAFDLRHEAPWPVVTIDMVAGPESAEVVAVDFDEFVGLIGVEPPAA